MPSNIDEVSLQIIRAIESMNQWTSQVMTSWVEYHIHRLLLLSIPMAIAKARTPAPQSIRGTGVLKPDVHEKL